MLWHPLWFIDMTIMVAMIMVVAMIMLVMMIIVVMMMVMAIIKFSRHLNVSLCLTTTASCYGYFNI